jgi:hypothetical protein
MNLAVQSLLNSLSAGALEDENIMMDEENTADTLIVIRKVCLFAFFFYYDSFLTYFDCFFLATETGRQN